MSFNVQNFDESSIKTGGGTSPFLEPGNHFVKLVDLQLERPTYAGGEGHYSVVLLVEGPDQGDGFNGWKVDPNRPELGNFAGQIGYVKHDRYSFSDYTNKQGEFIPRDMQIFNWINKLAKDFGLLDKMRAAGVQGETIEDYVANAKSFLVRNASTFMITIGGQHYVNKNGYDAYRLFLPRADRGRVVIAPCGEQDQTPENLQVYDAAKHILRKDGAAAPAAQVVSTADTLDAGFASTYDASKDDLYLD